MTLKALSEIPDMVSGCLQLALLLEVSAYPKPGNVHRTADFQETTYEHFLASAVSLGPHFRHAAQLGVLVRKGRLNLEKVGVGREIRDAVTDMVAWQSGGNTLLGSIILLTPIAIAAGTTFAESKSFPLINLRKNLKSVVERTTPLDAVHLYDAVALAKPGGMGQAPKLDVTDPTSKQKILEDKVTLYEVFQISAPWDSISSEWVKNYPITFDIGYPYLTEQLEKSGDVNKATVHTFLKILSEVPDTLIARKAGIKKAKTIATRAKQVLELGGLATPKGRKSLKELDKVLRDPKHQLNPGTTADLTAASLAITTLNGYRL